jgi:hypothetical protein
VYVHEVVKGLEREVVLARGLTRAFEKGFGFFPELWR